MQVIIFQLGIITSVVDHKIDHKYPKSLGIPILKMCKIDSAVLEQL